MNAKMLTLGLITLAGVTSSGQDTAGRHFGLESGGVRCGFGVGELKRRFNQAEAVADFTLPYHWDLGRTWELQPRLELCLGSFGNDHVAAVIGSVGSIISIAPAKSPVALEVGVSATGLSERDFEARGIGSLFQIRSMFGLSWTIAKRIQVGYHFQHISNGGLAGDNQGVNMHTFSVACCF